MSEMDRSKLGAYDHRRIEPAWQERWAREGVFRTLNPGDEGFDASKPKCYVLDMFPYPSGAGLHVGHPVGYCATDILSRFKRMRGFNVLHPIGFDAFGLPAEQYAIETGVHPADTTKKNIANMRRQLKMFGFSYDWDRELVTCEPEYYKFTQWIFLQLFNSWYDRRVEKSRPIASLIEELESGALRVSEALTLVFDAQASRCVAWATLSEGDRRRVIDSERLAYIGEVPVNWCPALGTVLANEEVTNEGRSDRGDHPVFRRPLRQWMLRITRYADRLVRDLDELDWPEPIKLMQRNWVGRSTGAEVDFPIASGGPDAPAVSDFNAWRFGRRGGFGERPEDNVLRIYTTRPDTLYGATYMVVAPEHPIVDRIVTHDQKSAVDGYVASALHKSDMDRTTDAKTKTGVFTGAYAFNPVNGERIPIWVADYVLMGYGTGAIMAVPGSDTRDFAFAKAFDLEIRTVVAPTVEWAGDVAVTAKGGLSNVRDKARAALTQSIERWKSDGSADALKRAEIATSFLEHGGVDDSVSRDDIVRLYVAAPHLFEEPFCEMSVAIQSPVGPTELGEDVCDLNGLSTTDAKAKIIDWLDDTGMGRGAVNYKLRDWLFSRQRYWGEPFPILHAEKDGTIIPEEAASLPIELPEMDDYRPAPSTDDGAALPKPPLGRAEEWGEVVRDGKVFKRELNTMPQWAGSCWYYLRFLDPSNTERFCAEEAEKYWMPIDLYVGGAEHAVLHLLYARFWHKVLFDLGHVSTNEPFGRLVNQGMIQSFAFREPGGRIIPNDKVEQRGQGEYVVSATGEPATQFVAKMSKALKNVVNPDDIIQEYGADTFRLYEMYMGPIESSKPWNTRDVPGLFKLVQRIWRLVVDEETNQLSPALTDDTPDDVTLRLLHKTIKAITGDVEQLKYNTAIAAMFEFVNGMMKRDRRPRAVVEPFVLLVSPFAPHVAEELWSRLGRAETLAYEPWPEFDPALARDEEVEIAVQILGKVNSRIFVHADADEKTIEEAALGDERIMQELSGKTVRKIIVVKGRLVNIVAN